MDEVAQSGDRRVSGRENRSVPLYGAPMPFRGSLVVTALTLAALLSGCSDGPDDETRADATGTSAPSASDSASASPSGAASDSPLPEIGSFPLAPGWPPEAARLDRNSTAWAVFPVVVSAGEDEALEEPFSDAVRMGYSPAMGAICASAPDGSELRFEDVTDPQAVSVYFATEASAREFAAKWEAAHGRDAAGIHEVRPACF
jgi:hypothetical protein